MEENKVIWPGWEVVRKIGSGSFGAVYEIRRDMFGDVEKAALKVIHIPQTGMRSRNCEAWAMTMPASPPTLRDIWRISSKSIP